MQDSIGALLAKRAGRSPDLEAIVDLAEGQRFSYREVNARANAMADAFRSRGIKKGDRVSLLMLNSIEFVDSFYGLAKIGAVIVPLNWRLVADELDFILQDSGVKGLIYDTEFSEVVADLESRVEGPDVSLWVEVGPEDKKQTFAINK